MEDNLINVSAAFDILIEQINQEIANIKRSVTSALDANRLDAATAAISTIGDIQAFRVEVLALRKKWQSLAPQRIPRRLATSRSAPGSSSGTRRRNLGRVAHGSMTPQRAYSRPILRALVKLGGAADANDVLTEIERAMGPGFNSVDLEPLNSNGEARWRKTAQWARYQLANQGLIRRGSPHGVWEISDAGRHFLETNP
jgi:hypothetical protein